MPVDPTAETVADDGLRGRTLAAVLASSLVAGLMIGMTMPLIALAMEGRGASATLVGLNANMPALATLLIGPFLPRLIAGIGPWRAIWIGVGLSSLCLMLFPVLDSLTAWFVLRFLLGIGIGLPWVVSETWINHLATEATRGRAVSLYATLWGAGIAAGPQLIAVTGAEGALPFQVAAAIQMAALLPLLLARRHLPRLVPERARGFLRAVWQVAPLALVAGFVSGFSENAVFSLLPLYGLRGGYGETGVVVMLTVFAAGSLLLQYPLGWLADRVNRRRLVAASAGLGLAGAALVPGVLGVPLLLWPLLFLWGGVVVGFYSLGLMLIGQHVRPAALAGANVAYIMAYQAGGMAGPTLAGPAMDLWDPHGLMAALAGASLGLLVVALRRRSGAAL